MTVRQTSGQERERETRVKIRFEVRTRLSIARPMYSPGQRLLKIVFARCVCFNLVVRQTAKITRKQHMSLVGVFIFEM